VANAEIWVAMEERLESRLKFYRQRMHLLAHVFNRHFPLQYYFFTMLDRHVLKIRIADLGSGPICTVGNLWDHRKITIIPSDVLQPHYQEMIDDMGIQLLIPTEYQDMEALTYPDNSFDIVHCVNAMDHTRDAKKAISEAVRICRPDGYIYLRHAVAQKRRWGGHHYWNFNPDGSINSADERFYLEDFHNSCDGNFVVSVMRKNHDNPPFLPPEI